MRLFLDYFSEERFFGVFSKVSVGNGVAHTSVLQIHVWDSNRIGVSVHYECVRADSRVFRQHSGFEGEKALRVPRAVNIG